MLRTKASHQLDVLQTVFERYPVGTDGERLGNALVDEIQRRAAPSAPAAASRPESKEEQARELAEIIANMPFLAFRLADRHTCKPAASFSYRRR